MRNGRTSEFGVVGRDLLEDGLDGLGEVSVGV